MDTTFISQVIENRVQLQLFGENDAGEKLTEGVTFIQVGNSRLALE